MRALTRVIRQFFPYFIPSLFFFLIFQLLGCASLGTYNPATGKREIILISTPSEVSMGKEVHKQIGGEYKISADPALVSRVERVGQRIARVSDRQDYVYHFYVLNRDEINAFTTPGGNIYVFTGLLQRLTTDDQLAGVIAHEVGHCAARHTVKKFQAALGYNLAGTIAFSLLGNSQISKLANMSSNAVMSLVFSAYSRQDEYQADSLAVKYMQRAGYDPQGMIQALAMLLRESKGKGQEGLLILRSHPYLSDRITAIEKHIRQSP